MGFRSSFLLWNISFTCSDDLLASRARGETPVPKLQLELSRLLGSHFDYWKELGFDLAVEGMVGKDLFNAISEEKVTCKFAHRSFRPIVEMCHL